MFKGSGISVQGPRSYQEDLSAVMPHVLCLADGMGGHGSGDIAAKECVAAFCKKENADNPLRAMQEANDALIEKFKDQGPRIPGAAVAAILSKGGESYDIAWAGDVRIYALQPDARMELLTHDHTFFGIDWMDNGKDMSELDKLSNRNGQILGCVGGIYDEYDRSANDMSKRSTVATCDLEPGTFVAILSDGVWDRIKTADIEEILLSEIDPAIMAKRLLELAEENILRDNATVIVAEIVS